VKEVMILWTCNSGMGNKKCVLNFRGDTLWKAATCQTEK